MDDFKGRIERIERCHHLWLVRRDSAMGAKLGALAVLVAALADSRAIPLWRSTMPG
jgi:hypothetical protein